MTDFEPNVNDGHDVVDATHREACAECAAVWADLERISAEAAALPVLSPSRDLWAGIDARIADRAPSASTVTTLDLAPRQRIWRVARLATAASLLIAATATVTWQVAVRTIGAPAATSPEVTIATAPQPDLAAAFGAASDAVGEVQQASLTRTTEAMDREIADLTRLVDERRESFDPRTIAVLEANLKLIDAAIEESRRALAADPASRFLAAQYARAYTSKLTLLRGAATLPAGD